ncbi:MAG: hypothetical protein KGI70_01080 [Patescibacteria group bacterium]|nr:hypothetical protein [Patescibacteria group bacterium]
MAETPRSEEGLTQADIEQKRPVYEVGFHLVPTVGEQGVGAVVEKIRKLLGGAEFISEGFPTRMTLAYTVERAAQGKREKYRESYFGWIKFATEKEHIPALEAALLAMPEALRSLIIETVREDIKTEPRRAVFSSDRLEGQTLVAPKPVAEKGGEVSEEELEKSLEALTGGVE